MGAACLIGGGCGETQIQPQWSVDPTGERYAPLPEHSKVKVFFRGEPSESCREIGTIVSTCPSKHWEGGQEKKGGPICVKGLREGARRLGAQAVVEVKVKRYRPEWEPETTWLIMRGVAVRFSR
jgi:hypothetical protein